jgi:diguanylate cyclase (GGDEF)-like protein
VIRHWVGQRRQRAWTVRAYLVGILVLATTVLLVAALLLANNSLANARDRGRHNAKFQAGLAARAIAASIEQGQTTVAGLASLDVGALRADPAACSLTFAGVGVFPHGHLDLALPGGRVLCSSVAKHGAPPGASHAGASWLVANSTSSAPTVSAPFTDRLTSQTAVAIVIPVEDASGRVKLLAALVLPLDSLNAGISATYSGPRHFAFTVTDRAGHVLSAPTISDPPQVPAANASDWLQSEADVPGVGWRIYAAQRTGAVLGPTRTTLYREAALGLGGLVLLLALLAWFDHRIAGPLVRLTRGVRHAANEVAPEPLLSSGPREIRSLADEFNTMMAMRISQEEHLRRHALHDPLTGLANRALLLDRIHRDLSLASANGVVVVAALDVDRFKAVNTNFGYRTGDAVLLEVAARVSSKLSPEDTMARLGGDEFVIVYRGNTSAVTTHLERILRGCFDEPFTGPRTPIPVTASIGIAVAERTSTPDDLVRSANLAMYAAKQAGGNRAVMFTEDLGAAASDRLALETELHGADDRGELVVEYQPIVNLVSEEITGVEALLRWQHPHRGQVPPSAFIPAAETTGLILKIGQLVLQQACRQAAAWTEQGHRLRVSVNLSGHQLLDPQLPIQVATALFESSLPADQLCLELTESTLMDDSSRATEAMTALKALGVQLSIDDFGTGYSSLAYLRRFPVNEVKVDRSFIQDLAADDDPALVAAMVAMGHALGLDVVAEGVEQQSQARTLRTLGCRSAQGYLFSRPQPPDRITRLLEQRQRIADPHRHRSMRGR